MKIFGNTSVQGRIAADTGSFKVYGITAGDQVPKVFIAGTDSPDSKSVPKNRSVVAHGQYDYIVASQDSGLSFTQAKLVAGSVVGLRVQHVKTEINEHRIYTLRTIANHNRTQLKSSINVSFDGGLNFIGDTQLGAYELPANIVAFDMLWINQDEAFVVGGTPGTTQGDVILWQKFSKYGLSITTSGGNKSEQYPVIFKKEANSDTFIQWGTAPTDTTEDCATAIAVSPTNSSIVIIGTQQGRLYKSTDGALTWTYVGSIGPRGTCVNRIKFVTGDSTKVYAVGTNASIYRSTSSGDASSWYSVPVDDGNGPLVILTRDNRIPSFNDILLPNTNDIIVVGDDHTRILKSSNSGTTWKYVSTGIYSDYLPIENAKSIRVGLANYYVAISRNKLFVALNPQLSGVDNPKLIDWVEHSLNEDAIDLQLVKDENPDAASESGYAFILTKTGVYEFSLNNNILSLHKDFSSVVNDTPTKLTAHSYREIYIITANSKIIRGTKYNYNFSNSFTFVEETSSLSGQDLITSHTAKTGRIFAGSNGGKIIFKDTGSIVNETTYSTDPVTWSQTSATPTASAHSVLQVQAIDNTIIYALVQDTGSLQNVLFNSTDSGSTWNRLYTYPEGIKKFIAYDTASIYAINQRGTVFYYTTSSFAEIKTTTLDNTTASFAETFDLDSAVSTTSNNISFLIGGAYGIKTTNAKLVYPSIGPWTDNSWTLCAIAGEDGYNYWIGGGTTFNAKRGSKGVPYDLGSEPILLVSSTGGETWENAISRLDEQEPPEVSDNAGGTSGGDFTFTSISEGQFFIEETKDVFNIYNSSNQGTTFEKSNSNLYRENLKYPGNLDGIRKIRFYDSKFGVAVGDITQEQITDGSKIAITTDGGANWSYYQEAGFDEYNINSVFITRLLDDGEYEVYVTAYPKNPEYGDGYILRSNKSAANGSFKTLFKFTNTATDGLVYQPQDIVFTNHLTGSVTIKGSINGTPSVEGLYRTADGGSTWNLITITDFAAGDTRGHLQFITTKKGYVAGTYGSSKNAGLFKTTDAGESWTRIITPYDNTANKAVSAMHFLTEKVGVISMGSEIWQTTDSGSNWSKVHDLAYTGIVNEIKFSLNGQLGFAVGHYGATNSANGEHFVLKSTNSGSSWTLIDSSHDYVNLEFEFDSLRNLIGQPSTLYTVGFAERIVLNEETQTGGPDGPDPDDPKSTDDCFGTEFMSASYYNFENFAYRCTISGSNPVYYPNSSNNIGLGRGIFGQNTSVELAKLRNKLTYGAALGVGALGKAEYSRADTAAGFGAMDKVRNAKNNVAIGYKALSSNTADKGSTVKTSGLNLFATSSIIGVTPAAEIVISPDAGDTWAFRAGSPNTGSYNSSSFSGSLYPTKIYKANDNQLFILSNDLSGSANVKTTITKFGATDGNYSTVYTSSVYNVHKLSVLTPSTVFGLDTGSGTFLKSTNGAVTFITGSILGKTGNQLKSLTMYSDGYGFIVGSKIWKVQSGSTTIWESSSYSGSHTLNAIDYINSTTWIAVGTSGSVYRTTNKGLNWNFISTGLTTNTLLDVRTAGSKIVAVGESGSIIVSSNSGLTWKSGSFGVSGSTYGTIDELVLLDNNTFLAKHSSGILKSIDGGKNWYPAGLNLQLLTFGSSENEEFKIKSLAVTRYSNNSPSPNPNYDLSANKALLEPPSETVTIPLDVVDENVAIGSYALSSFENSSRMVAIGANALKNVETDTGKKILDTVYEDVFKAIAIGDLIQGPDSVEFANQKLASNYGQVAVGAYSQHYAINTKFNTSVGYGTLYNPLNSSNNTAIGFYSQHLGQNHRNTSLGVWALGLNGDLTQFAETASVSMRGGSDNIAIGYKSLLNNLGSVRAVQISQSSGFSEPYPVFPNLGSRNMAIGNYALLNASGSADTIAIGYRAVSDYGFDLTDSVFIGNYVGQNFKTKLGTYYSSSNNNDWKLTQTVAVGSRTLQNHTGYDIVAVGANALRGTQTGGTAETPDITISTDAVGVLAIGFFNSHILARNDFSDFTDSKWSTSNYVKKRTDKYFIYDELQNSVNPDGTGFRKWDPRYSKSKPVSVAIASRNTAYAAIEQTTNSGKKYPLIVRTDKLSDANGKNSIEWNTIQPGLFKELGSIVEPLNKSMVLNTPDENTMYLLVKRRDAAANKKYESVIYKATSTTKFQGGTNPISFSPVLNGWTDQSGLLVRRNFDDMHFPTVDNGIAVGFKTAFITSNSGVTWTSGSVDNTTSGSGVTLSSVWMNNQGTVAYAAGNYGSIYKWTSGGGWVKTLGASSTERYGGNFWNNVLIRGTNASIWFATKPKEWQQFVGFSDIRFLNDSFGIAIGLYPKGGITTDNHPSLPPGGIDYELLIAKTTDGGTSWEGITPTLPELCRNGGFTLGEGSPQPFGEITIIDQNKAIIGMSYGHIGYTTDGGSTWNFTSSPYGASFSTKQTCGCDPYPITYCGDYKFFESSSITVTGSQYQDIFQVVTVGSEAQAKQTSVNNNVAIGYKVQFNGTGSASDSVQIGASATIEGNSITDTVAIGKESLYRIQYSDKNTAVGKNTLDNLIQTNAAQRAFPGPVTGDPEFTTQTNSSNNTVVGYKAGTSLIAGDRNVFIGVNAGQQLNAPQVKTWGNNNIVIGADAPKTQFNMMNQVALGNQQIVTHVAWGVPGVAGWAWQSDGRDKADTGSFTLGLDFIRQIQPKEFKWDGRFSYASGSPDGTHKHSGSSYGYIAQELESAAVAVGVSSSLFILGASGSYSGSVSDTGSFDIKLVKPAMVNLVAINAIKQLDSTVTYLSSSKYTTNLGDGSNLSYGVTHSLGTRDVIAMVYGNSSNLVVYPTMSINSTNTMTVTFNTIPSTNEYRLVVMR